ncbi:MAG: family 16 glycoside hydrolase [Phycisphaerales bacterium]
MITPASLLSALALTAAVAGHAAATLGQAAEPVPAVTDLPPLEPGASVRLYELDRSLSQLRPLVPGQTPNRAWISPTIDLLDSRGDYGPVVDDFLVTIEGWIVTSQTGEHRFRLSSDDGSRLTMHDAIIVDNDGLHGLVPAVGRIELAAGAHPFRIDHFEATGDAAVVLEWMPPGETEWALVPESALRCAKGEVRVTAPGPKRVLLPLMRGRPGDGTPVAGVHPSYRLVDLRPNDFTPRVGGLDWLPDGRMLVCTWDRDGAVYLLENTDSVDGQGVSVRRIAAGLAEPLGLRVVDGRIFVLQKQELTELIDLDGDDVIDEYRAAVAGWDVTSNFHEFAFGLVERDGFLYANLATAIDPGGRSTDPQVPDRGTTIRLDPENGTYDVVARGLRTPNGIGIGAGDRIYITDNQGDWLPVSKVLALREGAFYGSRSVAGTVPADAPVDPPVVWLPQNEVGNSPSEVAPLPHGPYAGQQVHGEVTHGGLKRVFVEEVDGILQGAVFRFTQGMEAGINRVRLGPPPAGTGLDGTRHSIYVGGIGSTGNWGQTDKLWHGLQRMDYTGEAAFEPLRIRAMSNGLTVDMTQPAIPTIGIVPEDFEITRWRYEATSNYGGPKLDETAVSVLSVTPSADRTSFFLEFAPEDVLGDFVYHVRLAGPWRSVDGLRPWTNEAWYTMNRVPADRVAIAAPVAEPVAPNTLTDAERAAGFRLLFDGQTMNGWRGFRQADVPDGWQVEDGCIVRVGSGGDLITDEQFGNFELRLEWAISEAGNSGIFWRVSEDFGSVWETGPEMQVLHNEGHADGQRPLTSAGSCYALLAPEFDSTRDVGQFNRVRLVADGSEIEYWLNGELQCRFDLASDAWKQLVEGSKFAGMPNFGRMAKGHLAIQDHGDVVRYRSIRIRTW